MEATTTMIEPRAAIERLLKKKWNGKMKEGEFQSHIWSGSPFVCGAA